MAITRVLWQAFQVPFRRPADEDGPPAPIRHGLLVRVATDDGRTGLGEASPVGAGTAGEVAALAAHLPAASAPLLGAEPDAVSIPLSPAVPAPIRFGLATAVLDLAGRSMHKPMARVIGGVPRPIPVNILITARTPAGVRRQVREGLEIGVTSFKVKVARASLDEELAVAAAVRGEAGPGASLRLDANGGWTETEAISILPRFEPIGIEYVEQPVPPGDADGMALVRRSVSIPVAADESVVSLAAAVDLAAREAADLFVVKAARLGFWETIALLREGTQRGWTMVVTSSLESGVGLAASLHLASLLPAGSPACGLATSGLLESDLVLDPPSVAGGQMEIPAIPGLGVLLDPRAVERYAAPPAGAIPG